jgi:adenylate cyclase
MEIERKFLIESPPRHLPEPGVAIDQGYLAVGDDGSEVRVRRAGERLTLTAKRGDGLVRGEHEVELSAEQFDALWPATEGRRLRKTRFRVPAGELTIELDLYAGELSGLAVAEVEFPSIDAADTFEAPAWFGAEVTDDPRYKNRALAQNGAPPDR